MWIRPLLVLGAMFGAAPAMAQSWPTEPIHWIVPFSPGGPTDVLSRYVATQLSASLGKPVLVENVLGASGSIGLDRLAQSKPDGYTIGTTANTLQAVAPHLSKLPYDTVKSFTPLGGLASFPFALVVGANSPLNSVNDLIKKAKSHEGSSAGSAGVGTGTQLAAALLGQRAGVKFNEIQYKGAAPTMTDVIGGFVDFTFDVIGSSMPMIQSGRVKALATSGPSRHPMLPNVPTVGESVPGYEVVGWFAVFGPANMPPEIVRRINEEINTIQKSAGYKQFLETRGYQPLVASPTELATSVQSEYAKWGAVIKAMSPEKKD